MNLDKVGNPLALIRSDDPKLKNKVVSVFANGEDDDDIKKPFRSLKLNGASRFQPIGNWNLERTTNYIVGASGSGKSTYIANWIKEYKKKYKDHPIYLFSVLKDDESIDAVKPSRILLDDQFIRDPIDISIYANSCCVFDDCDSIPDKRLKDKVYQTLNLIASTGRHHKITLWCVSHTATDKGYTKTILNEAHTIT